MTKRERSLILLKCQRVIDSCETVAQVKIAFRFLELATKRTQRWNIDMNQWFDVYESLLWLSRRLEAKQKEILRDEQHKRIGAVRI
jgi:hypothetical protein